MEKTLHEAGSYCLNQKKARVSGSKRDIWRKEELFQTLVLVKNDSEKKSLDTVTPPLTENNSTRDTHTKGASVI